MYVCAHVSLSFASIFLCSAHRFLKAVVAVANADSAAASFRDRITFSTPEPLLLRKMAGLLQTQLHRGRCQGNLTESGRGEGHVTTSGCGQGGGVSGEVILQFWLHIFLSYPSWYRSVGGHVTSVWMSCDVFSPPTNQRAEFAVPGKHPLSGGV